MKQRRRKQSARARASPLQRTAIHEAGHAVCVVVLGAGILERVCVVVDGPNAGEARFDVTVFEERVRRGDVERAEVEAQAIVLLAGDCAEFLLSGRRSRFGAARDHRDTYALLRGHAGSAAEARHWLRTLDERARHLVARPPIWRSIRALAEELVEHRRLEGHRAHAVIISALLAEASR